MRKLILTLLIICMTAFCFQYLVFADIQADIDNETSRVTVNIQLEDAANKKAAIEVFKPGKGEADIASLTPENISDVYSYVREVTADSNSKITFTFKLGNELGKYSVRVRADGSDAIMYANAFTYISPGFESDFLLSYCAEDATSAQRLELLESNAEILGFDLEVIQDWEDAQKLALIDFVGKDYASVSSLEAAYECGIAASLIKNGSEASEVSAAFDKYSTSLKAYCEIYSLYETYFTTSEKGELYDAMAESAFSSIESFAEELGEKMFLHSVNNADNHLNIEAILRTSESWLNEDFDDYYALSVKKDVNMAIMNGSYNTSAELCKALHDKVKEAKKDSGTGSSSGGSVSPSGTKGSSVNVQVGASAVPQTPSGSTAGADSQKTFTDVYTVPWAQEAIYALSGKGIVNGVSDVLFLPDSNVTREEFVKLLVGAFFEADAAASADFADVSNAHWSYPYIASAVKKGIINGISETEFGLGMPITRQDMAVMLHRAMSAADIEAAGVKDVRFTDEAAFSGYAYDAVMTMAKAGIINGFEDGSFAPSGNATRAQAAKVIYEAMASEGGR